MTSIKQRIANIIKREQDEWDLYPPVAVLAEAIATQLGLTQEIETDFPVFVEDVPRRPIEDRIGLEGEFMKHIEFIPHSRYKSCWESKECPDCASEPGVHDRRHAEILAATQKRDE